MFNRIPSGYALIAATLFLLNLPSVRLSGCRSILQSICQSSSSTSTAISIKNYLANPFGPHNESLEVRCELRNNDTPVGWSLSPDGAEEIKINTSLAKYTVSENTLRINGVNASDEGLYRCVYASGTTIKHLCIFVHARAVFASCRSSYDGCSEPENISVTAGEDIHFNASIIHVLGGNCGPKQIISHVELWNCSNVDCMPGSTLTGNDRISATMSPDIERRFILSHSTIEDSGVYQVVVRGIDPQDGAQFTSITKTYRIKVQEPTTTTIATTEEKETTVANGTSFSTATTDASQSTKPTTTDSALHCSSAKPILCATLAVTVTILAIIILLIIILVLLFKLKICTLRKLKDNTLLLSRDDNVGQEAYTRIQIDGENTTFTHDVAVTASSQTLNENDSAHHSDNTAPHLCGNQQEKFDGGNASSSSGTSTPAPEYQSNDDQDILSVLQDSNASSSSGTSTPASEHQSNNDQDILSATESQRSENSPEDVGEQCGPSEIQRAKREGLKRLDLSSRPALPDLMNHVASKTPTKWMVLGIQLGLEAAQLQALDHQHRGRSDSIFADIFDYWGKSSGLKPVTWSTMIEALKSQSVGEMALAHHLESTVLSTCRDSNKSMDDGWQQSQE